MILYEKHFQFKANMFINRYISLGENTQFNIM